MKKLLFIIVMIGLSVCIQVAYSQNSQENFKSDNVFFQELIKNISQSKDTNLIIEHGSRTFCAVYSTRYQHESIVINSGLIIIQSWLCPVTIDRKYAINYFAERRSDDLRFWEKYRFEE